MPYHRRKCRKREVLHLHSHDFLVGAHHFIPRLQEQLKGELGLLRGQDGGVQLLAFPPKEALDRVRGIGPLCLHLLDCRRKHILKCAAGAAPRRGRGSRNRD